MAYFYVKTGGTATGDAGRYATQQTGSFATLGAANYYGDMAGANSATTPPAAGDYVCISTSHTESPATDSIFPGSTTGAIYYVSVSDTACQTYTKATSAQFTPVDDVVFGTATSHIVHCSGLWFYGGDDNLLSQSNISLILDECTVEASGTNDRAMNVFGDGCSVRLINSDVKLTGGSGPRPIVVQAGGRCTIIGGTYNSTVANYPVFRDGNTTGGANVEVYGLDITNGTYFVDTVFGTAKSSGLYKFVGCTMDATFAGFYTGNAPHGIGQQLEVLQCEGVTGEGEGQLYIVNGAAVAQNNASVYRDGSLALPASNSKISIKIDTTSACSPGMSFRFDKLTSYIDLATTDTVRIYFISSDATLTSRDVWATLLYPDGTTYGTLNLASTAVAGPLASGSSLSTNTEAWTGRTTETRYHIDLDTSGDAGTKCAPVVQFFIGKASTTIYLDPTIEAV